MEIANGKTNQLIWKSSKNRYHVEDHEVDLNNTNSAYSLLAQRIEPGSAVLDVACGEGRWGSVLSKKKCRIFGIDIDDEALNCVGQTNLYEKLWNMDIERADVTSEEYCDISRLKKEIDYIGLLDILEHTVNPTKVIENIVPFLEDGKKILVSVPNIAHADIFLNLMRGRFNYQEMGILDNTHTKYFTKLSFVQWIQEINLYGFDFKLDCQYLGGTFADTAFLEDVKINYPDLYQLLQNSSEYNVVQLLFELTKTDKNSDTPFLNEMLKDIKENKILEVFNKEISGNAELQQVLNNGTISWNERSAYKKQLEDVDRECKESSLGWKNCNAELEAAYAQVESLKAANNAQENAWKESELGWKNCNAELEAAYAQVESLKAANNAQENAWKESELGWKNCNAELEAAYAQVESLKIATTTLENTRKAADEGWRQEKTEYEEKLQECGKAMDKKEALNMAQEKQIKELQKLITKQQDRILQQVKYKEKIEKNIIGKIISSGAKKNLQML